MSWHIRAFDLDRDAKAIAELYTWNDEFTWTEADFAANVRRWPAEKPMLRLVAEQGGETVAYGRSCEIAPNPMGSFLGEAIVRPDAQRRGIGRELIALVESWSHENGARVLSGTVRERRGEPLSALNRMGYETKTLYFECERDPRTFDPAPFKAAFQDAASKGYEIRPLADLPVNDHTDRMLYDAMIEADHDAPFMDYFGYLTFEDYRRQTMGAQWYDRRGVFVALKDGVIVGLSSINKGSVDFNGEMFIEFTGVVRAHRGHGLATLMKVRALEYAKAVGGTRVRTENNTDNAPMLKVNRKLGFVDKPGMWLVAKPLKEAAHVV